jgi:ApbE superfamily uncharacterized protein (UPF0280 family)
MGDEVIRRQFRFKETFVTVITEKRHMELAARTTAAAREDVEAYIADQPRFLASLEPLPIDMGAPPVVRRMAAAAALVGVGPMAAVAGAIAQETVEALKAAGARHVVVDNGGDVVLAIDRPVKIGIFTGPALIRDIALCFEPRPGIFSVCTSSGTVGHSLSFGCADAATVIADNGCLADAMATALGNRVKEASEKAIGKAIRDSLLDGIEGLLVVAGERMGMGGTLPPIVRAPRDVRLVSKG